MATIARTLFVALPAALALALMVEAAPVQQPAPPPPSRQSDAVVYLAGGLSDEALICLGAAVASRPEAVLLLDSRPLKPYLKHFLGELKPKRLVAVGTFDEDRAALAKRLGVEVEEVVPWSDRAPARLFPKIDRLVVCKASPRPLLLDAACLAGADGARLWVAPARGADAALRSLLAEWKPKHVTVVGQAAATKLDGAEVRKLPRAEDVRS